MTVHLPPPGYPPFHLGFAVADLDAARRFHGDCLGCAEGRATSFFLDPFGNAPECKAFADIDRLSARQS